MQNTSELWKELFASTEKEYEYKAVIERIEYRNEDIFSLKSEISLMPENKLTVGNVVARTMDITIIPKSNIPRAAEIKLYLRMVGDIGTSEWLSKGTFYIDTRQKEENKLALTCYDIVLKMQKLFLQTDDVPDFPMPMDSAVNIICTRLELELDEETVIDPSLMMEYPNEMSMREVLGYIASAHGGNFVVTEVNKLRLVQLEETEPVEDIELTYHSDAEINDSRIIKKVVMYFTEELFFEAGVGTFDEELLIYNEWATQAMVDNIYGLVNGYEHIPYNVSDAYLDPAVQVGDYIIADGKVRAIQTLSEKLGGNCLTEFSCPGESSIEHEYPYEGNYAKEIKQRVIIDKAYYGVKIGRANGLEIKRSDSQSEAIFNSDVFSMRSKDENGDMKDAIFFDTLSRKYRISGDVIVDGSLSSDANFTNALYAEQGDISQLRVDQLSTSRRLSKYLENDESDDNYLEAYGQGIYWVTANVEKDSSGNPLIEQLLNRYGDKVFWSKDISNAAIIDGYPFVDGLQIYTTTDVTEYPIMVYQYNKKIKLAQQFYYHGSLNEYIPKITLGVGDETGMAKGHIEKDIYGLVLSYDKRDGTKNFIRIGENGFETNMQLESSQPDYAIYEKNSNINLPATSQMTFTLKKDSHVYFYHNFTVECTTACTITYRLSLDGRLYSTGYYQAPAGKSSHTHQYFIPAAEEGNKKLTWNYAPPTSGSTLLTSMAWINSAGLANGALPVPPDTRPHVYDKLRGRIIGASVEVLEVARRQIGFAEGIQGNILDGDVGISLLQRMKLTENAQLQGNILDSEVGITLIDRRDLELSEGVTGNILGATIEIIFPE